MDTIKFNNCEEYVLVELINEKSKNERLVKEIEELKEQNGKLMDMFKICIKQGGFKKYNDDSKDSYFELYLHSWMKEEGKVMNELLKIKEQLEDE